MNNAVIQHLGTFSQKKPTKYLRIPHPVRLAALGCLTEQQQRQLFHATAAELFHRKKIPLIVIAKIERVIDNYYEGRKRNRGIPGD